MRTDKDNVRFLRGHNHLEPPLEDNEIDSMRWRAITGAQRKTLEVGVGTGANLPFYSEAIRLTAIDQNPRKLNRAIEMYKSQNDKPSVRAEFIEMDLEQMAFDNNTFDTVVSTFVFSSVDDPLQGLNEVFRVLKPGGKAIFLEQTLGETKGYNLILKMLNCFSKPILGASLVRQTQQNIEEAGFFIDSVDKRNHGSLRLIVASKPEDEGVG